VNEALRDELIVLVESGWPVIALETFEESRALEVINSMLASREEPRICDLSPLIEMAAASSPRWLNTAGRGRSVGRSSGATPSSRRRQ